MIQETEIKKDLYKSKNMAKFSHYCKGALYYNVELTGEEIAGTYQFPLATIEAAEVEFKIVVQRPTLMMFKGDVLMNGNGTTSSNNEPTEITKVIKVPELSSDLGSTSFEAEIKGSDLNRWIAKALKNEQFIKIG